MMTTMQLDVAALHRRGRLSDAIAILDRLTSPDDATSLLLRARLSLELSPSGTIAVLDDPRLGDATLRHKAEAAMLRGRAHTKLGEFAEAERCFALARSFLKACAIDDETLRFEIELSLGTLLVAQSRVDEAERVANALADEATLPSQAAAAFVLLSKVAWRGERLDKNAGYLLQALRAIALDPSPDVQLWADTLRRLAYVYQFVASAAVREALTYHVTALPWPDELADSRSLVYQLLGTRAILDGEVTEGSALFKRASTIPGASLAARTIATISRAQLSRSLGEPRAFEDHLFDATALAQQIHWRQAVRSDRQILLHLAELHASRDSALAHSFAAHFDAIGRFGAGETQILGSPAALQNFCIGSLYLKTGNEQTGIAMLEAAFTEYRRLQFDWAAGETAIVLAEATNSIVWRAHARDLLAKYPESYLKIRLANLERIGGDAASEASVPASTKSKIPLLTPAQRIVYYRLLEDVPVKAIAADLKRSDLTVRNHIQAIFRKFGVRSRSELIASRF